MPLDIYFLSFSCIIFKVFKGNPLLKRHFLKFNKCLIFFQSQWVLTGMVNNRVSALTKIIAIMIFGIVEQPCLKAFVTMTSSYCGLTLSRFLEDFRTWAAISSSSLSRSLYDLLFSLWLRPATRPLSPSIPISSIHEMSNVTIGLKNVWSNC